MHRALILPFILIAGWIGCTYLTADPHRTSSPAFQTAKVIASMQTWGVMFLLGAVALTIAAVLGDRQWLAVALFFGGMMFLWWGGLFGYSAWVDSRANPNGPAYCWFVAAMYYAAAWRVWVPNR